MPQQTTKTENVYFPDGAVVSVKEKGGSTFTDLGAISTAIAQTLTYETNDFETANASTLNRQIRNMKMNGSFTLINLNQAAIEKIGGGMFTVTTVAGTLVTDANITDQTIAAGWAANLIYDLEIVETATGSNLKPTAKPTLTSVVLDPTGVNETLTEDLQYTVYANANSVSGWSISFIPSSMTEPAPTVLDIVVDYGDNTPLASSTLKAGSSTVQLQAYEMQVVHTDSNGLVRKLEMPSVDTNSDGFQINYKGANEDGVEEMPLTYTAKLATDKPDGEQLFKWTVDEGAA